MARKTPQRPRSPQAPRRPNVAPATSGPAGAASSAPSAAAPAGARAPRAPRLAVPNVTAAVDYEADLAVRYQHVKRDLIRIVVLGTLLFALIFAAKLWAAHSGGQLFFSF